MRGISPAHERDQVEVVGRREAAVARQIDVLAAIAVLAGQPLDPAEDLVGHHGRIRLGSAPSATCVGITRGPSGCGTVVALELPLATTVPVASAALLRVSLFGLTPASLDLVRK